MRGSPSRHIAALPPPPSPSPFHFLSLCLPSVLLFLQDSTYVALEPPDVVTAWLALTPSSPANGCLHFQPGSHLQQLPHVERLAEGNLLLKGQTVEVGRGG